MRRLLLLLLLILLTFCPTILKAQNVAVSATITDSGGVPWVSGTYTFTSAAYPQVPIITGTLDSTGSFTSVTFPTNATTASVGSQWTARICPIVTSPCFAKVILVPAGPPLSLTSSLIPPAITISALLPPPITAYADSEIINAVQGSRYLNVTDSTEHVCKALPCSSNWQANLSSTGISSNVLACDTFPGTTADVKITNCMAALPAAGGTADARGIVGTQSFASTLVITKTITLLLGAVRITGPSSGDIIDGQAQGISIKGIGSMQNTGATQGTVLIGQTAAQADGIHFQSTGSGNVDYYVSDLSIIDSTAGGTTRTAGKGLNADAAVAPAQNSIGAADRLYISFFFYNFYVNRPITSYFTRITSVQAKRDGIVFQGDGTSTSCKNCYANFAGRYNYSMFGMNYSSLDTPASDHAVNAGYHIGRCQEDSVTCTAGNIQSIGISLYSPGAEVDSTGGAQAGIYCLDCVGLYVSGAKVLTSGGFGIQIDGGRSVTLSGVITGSSGADVQVTQSATPIFPAGIILQNLQYATTGGGAFGAATSIWGYNGSAGLFTFTQGVTPATAAVADLGATALPWANLWLGTAATNNLKFQPAAMAAARVLSIPDPLGPVNMPYVIASGTSTLTSNAALAAVTSQVAITTTATNTLTTDAIEWSYASAPTAGDSLCYVSPYVTAGNVNFVRTNPTAAAQNVSALVINWRVVR